VKISNPVYDAHAGKGKRHKKRGAELVYEHVDCGNDTSWPQISRNGMKMMQF